MTTAGRLRALRTSLAGVDLRALVTALAIGAVGGALFAHWQLPLPWMIGALVATTAAAIGDGLLRPHSARAALRVPAGLRQAMLVVIGIMLGAAFDPAAAGTLQAWAASLLGLALYVPLSLLVGYLYLRRTVGFDPVTAYFTAAPGGLVEMTTVGAAAGGDERRISLAHSIRIMAVVMTLPFWLQMAWGYEPALRASLDSARPALSALDALLLAACVLGVPVARRLRLPAAQLTGPMLLSALIHVAGLTAGAPPAGLVALAQVIIGSAIGARFAGVRPSFVLRIAAAALGLTALLCAVAVPFVVGLARLTGLDPLILLLAYAPGGVAEMSLVALAMDVDPSFVATHHVVRIGLVVLFVPLAFRLVRQRSDATGAG